MPISRKLLCAVYATIAVAALLATWSQNAAYFQNVPDPVGGFGPFLTDTKVTPASRSITVDIVLFFLAAAIFMVIEARKHRVRFVLGLYRRGASSSRSSVTFPLFPIAREWRLATADATPPTGRRHHPAGRAGGIVRRAGRLGRRALERPR